MNIRIGALPSRKGFRKFRLIRPWLGGVAAGCAGLTISASAFAQKATDYRVIRVTDALVANTDSTLQGSDQSDDAECSLTVNPTNPNAITMLAFSSNLQTSPSPLWHSTDGGQTWTQFFSIEAPPGTGLSIPNDQTLDSYRNGDIAFAELGAPQNIATGFTTDPTSLAAFNYFSSGGVAQLTNNLTASSLGNADQPWVLVNADPTTTSQDDTYVAYVDLSAANWNMRVAASYGAKPPNFTVDNIVGTVPGPVNGSDPGLRIAKDTASGAMFALWETCASNCSTPSPTFNYVLNRSVDGGHNWSLGGSTLGTNIASGVSTQPGKFGGVNALIGGVLHGAVNPADHSVYYVYGTQDTVTGNNRLGLRRVVADAAGNATVGPERFVTGEVQAALPQVAVDSAGNVGVFYYTFDGNGSGGLPNFTAHIAISDNQGATFTTSTLVAFQSPVPDSGASRQRILGDYEQMKSVGNCFHGAFAANGFALGRTVGATNTAVAMDPAYFQVCGVETAALRQIVGTATALPLPAGNVNITGDFTPVGPLNLNTATVTLQKVLTDGAGEHVQGIPITLAALPGGSTTAASYLSIVVPTVAMQIAQVPLLGDFVQLNIAVDGVTRPPSCGLIVGAASLSTQFKIDDGVHPPLVVSGSNTWACAGPELIAP